MTGPVSPGLDMQQKLSLLPTAIGHGPHLHPATGRKSRDPSLHVEPHKRLLLTSEQYPSEFFVRTTTYYSLMPSLIVRCNGDGDRG